MSDVAQQLCDILGSLDKSSRFCTAGNVASVLPGLVVEDVGEVALPISASIAKRLIREASQAPYGRGKETIVDTDIRRVWQIEPKRLSIRNPEWDSVIAGIVDDVKREFAIGQRLKCDLYKLLIYEKGSFFSPHRDSEKQHRMFATLVVCMPSRHIGGALVVSHDGETREIHFGGATADFKIQYAAFYTDCRHEIRPVTSGYRICLVYNLALGGRKRQPRPPQHSRQVEQTATLLKKLFADTTLDKIAIPFEHQYTEAGLSREMLKGADRSRAEVLQRAAERLGYQFHMALLTFYQMGEVERAI